MRVLTEIRWHGRGGQGAKTAALLLADVAFNLGKYVQGFPEYGPERMGAPITAYDRISDKPIRVHSNIYEPDFVVVVDETLLHTVDVTKGLKKEGAILINTQKTKEEKLNTVTFRQLYDRWEPTHKKGASTINCYRAAKKHFGPVLDEPMREITVDDLQECLDDCPAGKRTQENMKALCGLLYKYAIPRNLATINMGPYLVVNGSSGIGKEGLPKEALETLQKSVGTIPYADYIVAQCYLGFRPSEKIQPIIDSLTANKISGHIFCASDGSQMRIEEYREHFYEALESAGIENPVQEVNGVKRRKYTPHSCRHTFSTLMKNVQAPDKDKLALIGHTSTEMLRHYQDVDLDSLRKITDAI